jgi:hypothetical protein
MVYFWCLLPSGLGLKVIIQVKKYFEVIMALKKTIVEIKHDEGYGDMLLLHINNSLRGKDMIAERIIDTERMETDIAKAKERLRKTRKGVDMEVIHDSHLNYAQGVVDGLESAYDILHIEL